MELEKTLGQALEKENAMAREIGGLMEEKKEKERTIMRLMEENDAGKKYRIMANAEIEDKKELVQKLLREKNEIEEVKAIKEEYLTDSVARAKKKNGLLSVMSSATTVVAAAVSLAYVARVR
ncbi:hypothetical protein OIU76_016745 [Salix suchowensis]|nr:hypothetical protein OIU76_016745 [Salix suchowensis]